MRTYGWVGLGTLAAAGLGLALGIEPFHSWFYCFAWWSYLLVADALLASRGGGSLFASRRGELVRMAPLSIFVWLLFEGYNLGIRNWAYDGVPAEPWLRWPGYGVAFATVLPAVFVTSDLLDRLLFGPAGVPPSAVEPLERAPSDGPARWLVPAGGLLTLAPLVWPSIFFPAVWIGPIFLLDPLLERFGLRSLSLELAAGRRRRTWSLLAGGLACGLLWEFWNFWAAARWVYTVPFFGRWKLFEMPLAGFLGFPPFALECWILYHLLAAVFARTRPGLPRAALWLGIAALSAAILWGVDRRTVIRFAADAPALSRVARC